ncbi:hypothetical protein HMPREF1246_0093 [Acidaminococcus sp. BV3L6]|nr:hypothetical protein HMPREF1246_0093 [Acidaminococcus sp. BV3L6]
MYHASSYTNTLESTFLLYYKKKGFLLRGIPFIGVIVQLF